MNVYYRRLFVKFFYMCIDAVCACFSIYLACLIRQGTLSFEITLSNLFLSDINPYKMLFMSWVVATIFVNSSQGLYKTKREVLEGVELWCVVKATFIISLIVIVGVYLSKIGEFPRSILVLTSLFMVFFFSLWRLFKRMFVTHLVSRGYNNFNVLVVGAGKIGRTLLEEIEKNPGLGLKVAGFLDDFKSEVEGYPRAKVIGKISDFVKIARREFIHKVFITVHHDGNVFLKLLEQARAINVSVEVVPQGFDLTNAEFSKYNIGMVPVLEYSNMIDTRKQIGKRIFDIFLSLAMLVVFSPVFLVVGILIKIDSNGPVFYKSRRYGFRGRIFNMFKFRTMILDADTHQEKLKGKNEVDGPIFKMQKDPRVTKFGKFLRRCSLDEMPQIINVLKGEMSLVGPRPLPIDQIEKEDLRQLKRLEVRPGITGLWQIKGRSDISFAKLVKWDIWYINNWSFWLDLTILYRTIPVVIKGRGAY